MDRMICQVEVRGWNMHGDGLSRRKGNFVARISVDLLQ